MPCGLAETVAADPPTGEMVLTWRAQAAPVLMLAATLPEEARQWSHGQHERAGTTVLGRLAMRLGRRALA